MNILQDFIRQSFATNWEWTERYVDGLTQDELEFRPNDQCHSIGFILWHYGRALDLWVQTFAKREPQLYETGWAQRFGFEPEAMDVGFQYTADDLSAWKCPDKALLIEYANDARDNLLEFLSRHDDASLTETTMVNRRGETIPIAEMFRMLLWETNQHGGQAGYIRGMQRGLDQ